MRKKDIFIRWIAPYQWQIILSAIAGIGCATINVIVSDLLKRIINMTADHDLNGILWVILTGILLIVIGMISNYASIYLTGYIGAHIVKDIREQSMKHLVKTRPDYMERSGFGDTLARLTQDVDGIRAFAENYLANCIYVPIMMIVFSIYLCYLQSFVFICTMGPLVFLVIATTKLLTPVKLSQKKYSKMLGKANDNIKETYDGSSVIKAFAMEDIAYDKFKHKLKECLLIGQKNDWLQYRIAPLSSLIYELPIILAIIVGGWMTFEEKMTIGSLVAFVSLLKILIDPLSEAYQLWVNSKSAMANLERIQAIFDEPLEDAEQQLQNNMNIREPVTQLVSNRSLSDQTSLNIVYEIKDLCFSYDSENQILHNINLTIPKGSRTALVGMSGSGKSTLLKLLYRHYDTYTGEIKLSGVDLKTLTSKDFRERFALISQSPFLFPVTVADNIRIGKEDATDEEVMQAAKKAYCDEFISKLPQGYHTPVGENGASLSGGQMQRLSIARAILKNAEILLLDEPTAALDPRSEQLVNQALDHICEDRNITVITIAHRLCTIKNYDQIILLDHGRIVERGKHEELLRKEGNYAAFYRAFEK